MTFLRRLFSIFAALIIVAVSAFHVQAQTPTSEFIGNPGQWVSGDFLRYYHSSRHPELMFGSPIIAEFIDPASNHHVQYFEKARFDLIESDQGSLVISAPLGELTYQPGVNATAGIGFDPSVCHRFANSFAVCYAFWQFYQNENGALFLGQPLADTEIKPGGNFIQYFENGVLEWHPEKASGERVNLAPLGEAYFKDFVSDSTLSQNDPSQLPDSILPIPQVKVFVSKAIIPANSSQTIFVTATDQFQQPLAGAVVGVTATMPDGRDIFFRLPETDAHGISTLELLVNDFLPGKVIEIKAQVSIDGAVSIGKSWFRIWW